MGRDEQFVRREWKVFKNMKLGITSTTWSKKINSLLKNKDRISSLQPPTPTFDSWSILHCNRSKLDLSSICILSKRLISFRISFCMFAHVRDERMRRIETFVQFASSSKFSLFFFAQNTKSCSQRESFSTSTSVCVCVAKVCFSPWLLTLFMQS